jgi:branched-chain amino acid aminotransferase
LPGITRDSVLKIAKHLGIPCRETEIHRNQFYLADEAFFTGTAVEVTPIREVDQNVIGEGKPGPITKKIIDAFFKTVRGEKAEFMGWLNPL